MTTNDDLKLGEVLLYQTEDGDTKIDVRLQDGTLWLTQMQMAELFQSTKQNISLHINNIFDEQELSSISTVKEYLTVQKEGNRDIARQLAYYNLDIIISVGYRVRSPRGTQFRQWATTILKEYLIKGFALNDERLKNPGGWDYFDELLERIREIRASEKRFYQKIRDIYATSIDYNAKSNDAQIFFKTVQNKILWAITGKTAAELIVARANDNLPNMGLTAWQDSRVRKADVIIAKNYLVESEMSELNRVVSVFLELAEDRAGQRQAMTMKNWSEHLDEFLAFTKRAILKNAGSISHEQAEILAHEKFDTFDHKRRDAEKTASEKEYLEELEMLEKNLIQKNKECTVKTE